MSKLNALVVFAGCVVIFAFPCFGIAQDTGPAPGYNAAQDNAAATNNIAPEAAGSNCCSYFQENVDPSMGYVSGFGYPANGGVKKPCGSAWARVAESCENFKKHWHHSMDVARKVEARNNAWPKPFECADRQLYFSMWRPMFEAGFEQQSTLSGEHFTDDNELNGLGKSAVAMIMNNMPLGQRNVFIHRTGNEEISEARLAHVTDIVNTWYGGGRRGASKVAYTDRRPVYGSGHRFDVINRSYEENTPPPIIAVATGTGNTSDTGQ